MAACGAPAAQPETETTRDQAATASTPSAYGVYDPPATGTTPVGLSFAATPMTQPAAGARGTDPAYGTTIRRLLASGEHEYSQLQVMSDDGLYALLIQNGTYGIYRYSDLALIAQLPGGSSAPRWIPGTHTIFWIMGSPLRLMTISADGGGPTQFMTFPDYLYADTAQTYEAPSDDGRWTAMYMHNGGNRTLVAIDLKNKARGASVTPANLFSSGACSGSGDPDWMKPSPLGKYLMVQWVRDGSARCSGLELFDINTGAFVRQVHTHHNHSDPGVAPDGREFLATSGMASPLNNNYPDLVLEYLDNASVTHLRMTNWGAMGHMSCRGPRGVCLVSSEAKAGTGVFMGEIYAIYMDGSVRHLAQHRSTACDYWGQPKASISHDGKRITFTSDWGTCGNNSPYVIELPDSLLNAPGSPNASSTTTTVDAGVPVVDAGPVDTGVTADAGVKDTGVTTDAGTTTTDAGTTTTDAGTTSGTVDLQTTMASAAVIQHPAVGPAGTTTLPATSFVAGYNGGVGAAFRTAGNLASWPLTSAMYTQLLGKGEVEFWYKPDYSEGTDDTTRVLFTIGDYYNPPNVMLVQSDALRLEARSANWVDHKAATAWHAKMWTAGQWVHIRANWDSARANALQLWVNGTLISSGSGQGGFAPASAQPANSVFVGSCTKTGQFVAGGIIQDLVVRAAPTAP